MATSGQTTFSVNRVQVIEDALKLIGAISGVGSATSQEISDGSRRLNTMLKAWMAYGLNLFTIKELILPPVNGKERYTIGSTGDLVTYRPMDIITAYRRETATKIDVPLIKISREEYYRLSDKDTKGEPTNFYVDYQLNNLEVRFWPAPDANFVANKTFLLVVRKPFDDMVSDTNDFELPQEWYEAIVYGLASRLAPEYGMNLSERRLLVAEADRALELALSWDNEKTSVYLRPKVKEYM